MAISIANQNDIQKNLRKRLVVMRDCIFPDEIE